MKLCQHYTQSTDEQPESCIYFAVNKQELAEILYYKILETAMVQATQKTSWNRHVSYFRAGYIFFNIP